MLSSIRLALDISDWLDPEWVNLDRIALSIRWVELHSYWAAISRLISFVIETFSPALLKKHSRKLRKETGSDRYIAPQELKSNAAFTLTQTFTRPLTMLVFEPIVLFTGIFISLAWSMVFFYFQAYPIIFQRECLHIMVWMISKTNPLQRRTTSMLRKHLLHTFQVSTIFLHAERVHGTWNLYIAVGIGAASSCLFALFYDAFYEKAKKSGKRWASSPEYHRLPTSCVAGPCLTISLFWLAWSAKSSVHWIVPVLSGFVFGVGYQSIFISLLTYVTDAYRIYSASALASSMILRSIAGALFPLAADPLYAKLGVSWGTSVLGFASLSCIPIPFALLYFGPWIRKQSAFCQRLLEEDMLKSGGARTPQEA